MKAQLSQKETSQPGAESSTESKVTIVKFHQTKIQCIVDPDGRVHVALKPIMDSIGLHADSAWKSIKNDPILGAKHAVRRGLDAKNREFPMQTLPIEFVHGWLFSIDASKVSANARPKLIEFKEKCYDVLFNHFYGKYRAYEQNLSERRAIETEIAELLEEKAELQSKISRLRKRIAEINAQELSGQFTLNLKGGR